ncbi:hypothetical protein AC579_3263 [Pseudocercospora musae]|uniref:Uncharacterized protein n=1 Tax=Pseudocercospora musae TaxID=113226 RepID=A0A139GTZ6_9PEZI|nr:hypothetical protein AC579_3263 [Pseudocercospora musae]
MATSSFETLFTGTNIVFRRKVLCGLNAVLGLEQKRHGKRLPSEVFAWPRVSAAGTRARDRKIRSTNSDRHHREGAWA